MRPLCDGETDIMTYIEMAARHVRKLKHQVADVVEEAEQEEEELELEAQEYEEECLFVPFLP